MTIKIIILYFIINSVEKKQGELHVYKCTSNTGIEHTAYTHQDKNVGDTLWLKP